MTRNELGILRQLCEQWTTKIQSYQSDGYYIERVVKKNCAEDLKDILDELEKGIEEKP